MLHSGFAFPSQVTTMTDHYNAAISACVKQKILDGLGRYSKEVEDQTALQQFVTSD